MRTASVRKTNKYEYANVIQQHFGLRWEDVSEYEANSAGISLVMASKANPITGQPETSLKHDLREYRLTGYPTRVIFRRMVK